MIRTKNYKLIKWQGMSNELYDLQNDPWEQTNLSGDPSYQTIEADLTASLNTWITETDDDFDSLSRSGIPGLFGVYLQDSSEGTTQVRELFDVSWTSVAGNGQCEIVKCIDDGNLWRFVKSPVPASGQKTAGPVNPGTHKWKIYCKGLGGDGFEHLVLSRLIPCSADITDSRDPTTPSETFTVNWTTTNTSSCRIKKQRPNMSWADPWMDFGWGNTPLNGSQPDVKFPMLGQHTFYLDCLGPGGVACRDVQTHQVN